MSLAVGQSVERADAREKVTGRALYVGDMELPGMVWVKVLRSPHAHARILHLDASRAAAYPGVVGVLTRDDFGDIDPYYGPAFKDQPILAIDRVRFEGEPVVAVAAVNERIAAEALERVDVEYEPLPAAVSLQAALAPGAPIVHEEPPRSAGHFKDLENLGDGAAREPSNVAHEYHWHRGDPERVLAAAGDLCFEDVTTYPMVFHYALEPHGCIADWQGDQCVVYSATQHPFGVRKELAEMFRLPYSAVRVVVPYLGGAFGAKSYTKVEPLAMAISRKLRRPVRLCLAIEESFRTGRKPAARTRVRTSVTRDGIITARHIEIWYQLGAYADVGPRVTQKAGYTGLGPYRIPDARVDAVGVYTHTAPAIAYRGYGIPQLSLAYETQIDRIAEHLGMDPLELRLKNVLRKGETYIRNDSPLDADLPGDLRRLATEMDWAGRPQGGGRGAAMAVSLKTPLAPSVSNAIVRLHVDGTVTLYSSSVELGQGARTVMGQIVAAELGLAADRVHVVLPDTNVTPYDQATSSSRSTAINGLACAAAARDVREQLQAIAAEAWGVRPEDVRCDDGSLAAAGHSMGYGAAVAKVFGMPGGELIGVGAYKGETGDVPLKGITPFWEIGMVGAEVDVDPETGVVHTRRLVSLADVGKAINPRLCEGQDEGAMMMGLGHALYEQMVYEGGQLVNGNLVDYRVPLITDLPDACDTVLVENGDGCGPFGAKGIGESATTVMAPAIASAVHRATGRWVRDLPLTPEKVWRALTQAT